MNLQTDDIGRLFAVMQAAYGYQWSHKADAIPVWQAKLGSFGIRAVMQAAEKAIEKYPDYPPSVGQVLAILRADQPRITTYLPAPAFDQANADKSWDHMEKLAGRKLRLELTE